MDDQLSVKLTIEDCYNVTEDYRYLLPYVAKVLNTSESNIRISDHPCGDEVIFVSGKFSGYFDEDMMERIDLYKDWERTEKTVSFINYARMNNL